MRFLTTLLTLSAAIASATVTPLKEEISKVVHLPSGGTADITKKAPHPIVAARQGPDIPPHDTDNIGYADIHEYGGFGKKERYMAVWRSTTEDCGPESSQLFTIDGGKWGSKSYSSCYPFNTGNIKSFAIQADYGCQAYIRQGSCRSDSHLHMVDWLGACTPVPPTSEDEWSLEIICNGGTPEWNRHGISKRDEHAVSTAQADPRWIKYWITGNDQCQVKPEDSGTMYSGDMGDNFSVSCQTRPAFSGDTWIYVSDSHGCNLYMEVGPCENIGSFPASASQGQCIQVPPEWVNSVWSLRAICPG